MERILVKNLIRNKTCDNCYYLREYEVGYCLQLWANKQLKPGGVELPENRTCENWEMEGDQDQSG